jgi:ubiquinone/menaquinone biosynthesis C-methylase UbiE
MMTRTFFRRLELEPPPWLYALMAKGPLLRRIYRRVEADVAPQIPRGASLLDVGAGPGYLLCYLAPQRPDLELFALDLSHDMVRRGRERLADLAACAEIRWLVGDAQRLPFASQSFRNALSTFSLHVWPDPALGVKEIWRVLRPGGRAYIYEMNRQATRGQIREFAREERLPFFFVYLGFHSLAWNHALRAEDFATVFEAAGVSSWRLTPAHHLFWRVEIVKE